MIVVRYATMIGLLVWMIAVHLVTMTEDLVMMIGRRAMMIVAHRDSMTGLLAMMTEDLVMMTERHAMMIVAHRDSMTELLVMMTEDLLVMIVEDLLVLMTERHATMTAAHRDSMTELLVTMTEDLRASTAIGADMLRVKFPLPALVKVDENFLKSVILKLQIIIFNVLKCTVRNIEPAANCEQLSLKGIYSDKNCKKRYSTTRSTVPAVHTIHYLVKI